MLATADVAERQGGPQGLPVPRGPAGEARRDIVLPGTALERQIAAVWEKLFAPMPVSVRDDFFLDLGGHSLLAARMVSELRKSPAFQQLSMADVYRHPTMERLAEGLGREPAEATEAKPKA